MNNRRSVAQRLHHCRQGVLAAAVAQALCSVPAQAGPMVNPPSAGAINVNSTATTTGGADCTLRDAILAANSGHPSGGCPAGGTIVLQAGQTYSFSDGPYLLTNDLIGDALPPITAGVRIVGQGAVIERDPAAPPFRLMAVEASGSLSLEGVTLRNGDATFGGSYYSGGGALLNLGTATVTSSTLTGNLGAIGGAVVGTGSTTIVNSQLSGNSAVVGGAVAALSGELIITRSTISGNAAVVAGGGVSAKYGHFALSDSTVSGNGAVPAPSLPAPGSPAPAVKYGGGVMVIGQGTITGSTLSGNTAESAGGLFALPYGAGAGELTVDNSTISGNTAHTGIGGVLVSLGQAQLRHVTIAGNTGVGLGGFPTGVTAIAPQQLAGLLAAPLQAGAARIGSERLQASAVTTPPGSVLLGNSLLADNVGGDCSSVGMTFTALSRNLIQDGSCGATATPARLGPLADNGGPAMTHALLIDSPADDAADATVCAAVGSVDQRGYARGNDGNGDGIAGCDLGAYELDASGIPTLTGPAQLLATVGLALAGLFGLRRRNGRLG